MTYFDKGAGRYGCGMTVAVIGTGEFSGVGRRLHSAGSGTEVQVGTGETSTLIGEIIVMLGLGYYRQLVKVEHIRISQQQKKAECIRFAWGKAQKRIAPKLSISSRKNKSAPRLATIPKQKIEAFHERKGFGSGYKIKIRVGIGGVWCANPVLIERLSDSQLKQCRIFYLHSDQFS
jgi:hypothetical protein